jgi:hypothetical protein
VQFAQEVAGEGVLPFAPGGKREKDHLVWGTTLRTQIETYCSYLIRAAST